MAAAGTYGSLERKSEVALPVLRVPQVVGSPNLRLVPIDQRDGRLDPSVTVHSRGKIWVFLVESRSNHYFNSVHTRFSFERILSGQEKQAGYFPKTVTGAVTIPVSV